MKYKNRTLILYRNNFHIKIKIKNGLHFCLEFRKSESSRRIWYHCRIIFLQKINNREARRERNEKFKNRKAIIRIRPKIRLFSIEQWETSDNSRKKTLILKTKTYIRIEASLPGQIEVPARLK